MNSVIDETLRSALKELKRMCNYYCEYQAAYFAILLHLQ